MQPVSQPLTKRPMPLRTDTAVLFAAEGALLQLMTSVNSFGNNLFASALGASDRQLGLIQTVPNAVVVALLIPVGLLADRMRSSRTIPLISLLCIAAGYLLMAAAATLPSFQIPLFFIALAFTVGGPVIFNAQWQNFFGDVVRSDSRNRILAQRNRFMSAMGIAIPFFCSAMMRLPGDDSRLGLFRFFFLMCGAAALVQAAVLSAIPVRARTVRPAAREKLSVTWKQLATDRQFLLFFLPATFFYISWHTDWSMWYIAQVQYLHLTESQVTIHNGIFSIGQLFAIGLLAKGVQKKGADRILPLAAVGLMFCPLIVMVCTVLPQAMRMTAFTGLVTVLNFTQCIPALCIVQILLRVAPKGCRSAAVSLYTLAITLSNCIVPYLGVQLYTALGADYRALIQFNAIIFVLRAAAFVILVLRCRKIQPEA